MGWRYEANRIIELEPDERGWLWSEELESWLVADGSFLRLYDRDGQKRLTEGEALETARQTAENRAEALERQVAELERQLRELRGEK